MSLFSVSDDETVRTALGALVRKRFRNVEIEKFENSQVLKLC